MHASTLLLAGLLCAQAPEASAPAPAATAPAAYRQGFDAISERDLRAWLGFLASPELEGRDTGARGYDVACRYVATTLEGLGAQPGGVDGSWYQPFSLVERQRPGDSARLVWRRGAAEPVEVELGGNVDVAAPGAIEWTGPLAFVGHGLGALGDGPDEFHGLELEGTTVLILPKPGDRDPTRGARLAGAKRLLVVDDQRVRRPRGMRFRTEPAYLIEEFSDPDGAETVWISTRVADALFALADTSCARLLEAGRPRPFVFSDVSVDLRVELRREEIPSRNVVGHIPGSDPTLASEAVIVGAHLDHVGVRGDEIYYGADDDGSGCSALLGIAKGLLENGRRPARTTILIFFGAEERGLHGSRFYADHPLWPLEKVVAMFNIDMIGRDEEQPARGERAEDKPEDNRRTIHLVGSKKLSLELDPWIHRVNGPVGLEFEYDEDRVWRRSDHYNFAEKGLPVTFFFAGFHPDYHTPRDTIDKINWRKVHDVTRLVYSLVFEIGDRPRRLSINRI